MPARVTTLFNELLDLDGVWVNKVSLDGAGDVVVDVRLRRQRLICPECDHSTAAAYETNRRAMSRWQHLDTAGRRMFIRARLRRLDCPTCGVLVEAVPFARPRARFTRAFEATVAWLATRADQSAISAFMRIDWDTVGRICERVVADELDPDRLDGLVEIGVDEISWRKHHNYLTLVVDHRTGTVVWGAEGRDSATLDKFFGELGEQRSAALEAVSMDMGPAFAKSVRTQAPQAAICIDPFHAVALVTKALEAVRRDLWQQLRRLPDPSVAKKFKGARWALLKNPDTLTDRQATTLATVRRNGGALWRAYQLKEAFRAIFNGDLTEPEAADLLDRWCAWAQRCRLEPFVKVQRTIRTQRDGILAAIRLGLTNGRVEGLNNRVRLIVRRAFGFHTANAALALVLLSCGPITLNLPWQNDP